MKLWRHTLIASGVFVALAATALAASHGGFGMRGVADHGKMMAGGQAMHGTMMAGGQAMHGTMMDGGQAMHGTMMAGGQAMHGTMMADGQAMHGKMGRGHGPGGKGGMMPPPADRLTEELAKTQFNDQQKAAIGEKIAALKAVQDEGKALHDALRAQHEKNHSLMKDLKGTEGFDSLKEKLAPLHEQGKALHESAKETHQTHMTAMRSLKDGLKESNFDQVVSGLEQLVQAEKAHNQMLPEMLKLAQQMEAVLAK